MKPNKEMLEDRLENCEEALKGLSSYVGELKSTTAKLGTDKSQFDDDLMEAEQNIGYYQGEVAAINAEIGELPKPKPAKPGPGPILPQTARQGIGSVVLSAITFIAGAFLGSKVKSGKSSKDKN
jgi:hypothetical protein